MAVPRAVAGQAVRQSAAPSASTGDNGWSRVGGAGAAAAGTGAVCRVRRSRVGIEWPCQRQGWGHGSGQPKLSLGPKQRHRLDRRRWASHGHGCRWDLRSSRGPRAPARPTRWRKRQYQAESNASEEEDCQSQAALAPARAVAVAADEGNDDEESSQRHERTGQPRTSTNRCSQQAAQEAGHP